MRHLFVDRYGMMPLLVASQLVEPVPGRCLQVIEPGGEI